MPTLFTLPVRSHYRDLFAQRKYTPGTRICSRRNQTRRMDECPGTAAQGFTPLSYPLALSAEDGVGRTSPNEREETEIGDDRTKITALDDSCSTISGCAAVWKSDRDRYITDRKRGHSGIARSSLSTTRSKSRAWSKIVSKSSQLLIVVLCSLSLVPISLAAAATELPDLSKIPTPPTFVHKRNPVNLYFVLDETVVTQGQNSHTLKEVEFPCKAKGYPAVTYRWLKDGSPLNLSDLSHRVVQLPSVGTFKLTKLRATDAGKYQCVAENGNGTAVDQTINLLQTFIKRFAKDEPELIEVDLGDPYHKKCQPPLSVPAPKVYWIFMGDEQGRFNTINSSHISYTDEGTIYFHYIRDDDYKEEVYYTCTAENAELQDYKFGNRFQFIIRRVKRMRVPAFISPSEQYVTPSPKKSLKGEEIKMHCFFSGFPDIIPTWLKDGVDVNKIPELKTKIEFENTGRTLVIANVSGLDSAKYTCKFDVNKDLNRDITLEVQAAPYFPEGPPASKNASEGDSVQFTCAADGSPKPEFKFYKNGQPLDPNNLDEGYEIIENELRISALNKEEDGEGHNAVYQCLAKNEHGEAWTNFFLNILAFKPVILEGPGDTDAVMNKEKFLECKVFGSPMPIIEWTGRAMMGNDFEQLPVDANGLARLRIPSVQKDNQGRYICYAENKYGEAESAGMLTVRDATRLTKYMKAEETVFAGREHRFTCQVARDKNLDVSVTWLVNGNKVPEDTFGSGLMRREDGEQGHSLIIPETSGDNSGTYTCLAETRLDDAKRSGQLVVKDVPPSPHSNYITKCDPEAKSAVIQLSYQEYATSPAPVQEFWVEYLIDPETDPNAWMTYPVPLRNMNSEMRGPIKAIMAPFTLSLKPFGKYEFRVIARNEVGDSIPAMVEGMCNTTAAVPARNPDGVIVKGNTEDNLVVYWEPMPREDWNGPGFKYVVEYRATDSDGDGEDGDGEDGDGEDGAGGTDGGRGGEDDYDGVSEGEDGWKERPIEDPYADHVVIENVPTYKEYEARVRAVNDLGKAEVEPSTEVGYSGEGIPSQAPEGFSVKSHTSSTVTFQWKPVNPEDVNGEFKGYKIYHWYENDSKGRRKKRGSPDEQVASFDPTASEGTVYGMKPNKNNFAQIAVYNGANDGPRTVPLMFFLNPGPPDPVRDLNAFALSPTEVGVVWQPPREANGDLLGYMVKYCQIKTDASTGEVRILSQDCPELFVAHPTKHYRWTQLEASTEYRFQVEAKSSGGVGDPASVEAWTLPTTILDGDPYEPRLLEAGISDDHINVTWIPGTYDEKDPHPVGTSHYIKYRVRGAKDWMKAEPEGQNFTVQLSDLYPGTRYEVVGVSVVKDDQGIERTSDSPPYYYTTAGETPSGATAAWLIAIIVAIIILIIILIIVCLVVRNRGAKYPVSEKEREQGREPMLSKEEKGFGEYARPEVDEEKRSLTAASVAGSETDSMAEYGDGETGRFTEDGSFIGVYGAQNANRVLIPPGSGKSNVSTFV